MNRKSPTYRSYDWAITGIGASYLKKTLYYIFCFCFILVSRLYNNSLVYISEHHLISGRLYILLFTLAKYFHVNILAQFMIWNLYHSFHLEGRCTVYDNIILFGNVLFLIFIELIKIFYLLGTYDSLRVTAKFIHLGGLSIQFVHFQGQPIPPLQGLFI